MTLTEIQQATKQFADARLELSIALDELGQEIERIKRAKLPMIKRRVAKAHEAKAALKNAIEAAPDLFEKPRTVVLHGIKVGLRKGSGAVSWEDKETVIKLIKKYFADRKDTLIKTTESPAKAALKDLTVTELAKIGCTAEDTGDVPLIKPVDGDVEKLVNALLDEAAADEDQAEAA